MANGESPSAYLPQLAPVLLVRPLSQLLPSHRSNLKTKAAVHPEWETSPYQLILTPLNPLLAFLPVQLKCLHPPLLQAPFLNTEACLRGKHTFKYLVPKLN